MKGQSAEKSFQTRLQIPPPLHGAESGVDVGDWKRRSSQSSATTPFSKGKRINAVRNVTVQLQQLSTRSSPAIDVDCCTKPLIHFLGQQGRFSIETDRDRDCNRDVGRGECRVSRCALTCSSGGFAFNSCSYSI